MARVALEMLGAGGVLFRHELGRGPLRIGRASTNELVLTDSEVSGHHAVLAAVGGAVQLTDLRSTNGSTVNGRAVTRVERVYDGDVIGLGGSVKLALGLLAEAETPALPVLLLEDRTVGVRHTDLGTPCRVGAREVIVGPSGDVTVDGAPLEVTLDEPFEVAGHTLVLRQGGLTATTVRPGQTAYAYTVTVDLNHPSGPLAVFRDARGREHRLRSENRAVLVYLLAQRLSDDRAGDADAGGWCEDDKLRVGIWGATSRAQLQNNLNVLLRRTRKELSDRGFDGSCIQKIHGHTRLCVDRVEVA